MADSLLLIHNKVAAWDEVADSQLSPEHTIVFFWRQNRPEQLQKSLDRKFNIVLCPRLPMYLDYAQDTLQVHGVDWRKFHTILIKKYILSAHKIYQSNILKIVTY